ncbi:Thioredoxin family protein [Histomonas meleagridis]|uniref:Thioredoxin family protein n=1 Tax=Histomonas meleagridis TaxID=135588 RepID=UPI003559BA82|nr:Thioredoxin family protein [Histomonas meleagridis]KAH0802985.1 Thioredoxin family protein [Histomonas meleagridis]
MEVSTDHTVEELHAFVKQSGGLVVIDCYAAWCAPCKRLAMLLPKIAKDHKKVQFIKVNADQNNNIAQYFKVRSFPNVIFLKEDSNGGVVELNRVVGLNLEKIKNLIKEYE